MSFNCRRSKTCNNVKASPQVTGYSPYSLSLWRL